MSTLRLIALNTLYFLNVLLIFLLFVEDRVQLPVFLQVTGRLHPLVLHFPLVLLFVVIFLEYLGTKEKFKHPALEEMTSYVLYLFALSAVLSALFGFFLYKEGSYLGDDVILHKWIGTGVSLLAVVLIMLYESHFVRYYYGTLVVGVVGLIVAGHLGSVVTHGEGFITEPIRKYAQSKVTMIEHADSAIVFRDVIQPILNEKCLNCHNANRAKSDLILADYEGIMQGGKTGDAVVSGAAEKSLLYKYALLPMDDSLHMPPKDKLQLDRDEINLIGWWINTGAGAADQYVNLPRADSIQTIMAAKFQPKKGLDLLDISFADQDEIRKSNNPYRTVQQISATKPYIAVFLGSKKDFSAKDLNELSGLNDQIVSIDMGNSNVTDDNIRDVATFTHVEKLHLQNIPIGDEGVKHLRDLRYLHVLNLSGTKISDGTLEEISNWKSLEKLYLYNTSVSGNALQSLKNANPELDVYNTQFDLTDTLYDAQLTMPIVKVDSTFFRTHASVEVKPSRGRVKYYYTLDGTEPTINANLYTAPFQIAKTGDFRIRATMEGWADSPTADFKLLKVGIKPDRVILETKPDPKYSGRLDTTLVDGQGGELHRDKSYLGYHKKPLQVLFKMKDAETLSQVTLSFLENTERGVFAPKEVTVWGGPDEGHLLKLGEAKRDLPLSNQPATKDLITIVFPGQGVRCLRVTAKTVDKLPSWVPNPKKDVVPAIFIDEVSLQ